MEKHFSNLSNYELETINGGMAPAALYALGFVLHTSPLNAILVCGGLVATGIVAANLNTKNKKQQKVIYYGDCEHFTSTFVC